MLTCSFDSVCVDALDVVLVCVYFFGKNVYVHLFLCFSFPKELVFLFLFVLALQ